MKRLYSLLPSLLFLAVFVPSLHSQTRPAARPVDSIHLAHAASPEGEVEIGSDPRILSRLMLVEGARNAAHVMREATLQRQQDAMPADLPPTASDSVNSAPGRSRTMGVGFLATLPAAGASAIVNLSPRTAVQGLLGLFLGGLKTVTGRYLYYFRETTNFQPYIYGEAGAWAYDQQTVLGFGGGAGLEYFIERYPFMSVNVEFTMREIGFDKNVYDISGLAIGGGVHYYF